jgi:hypothetical protein
MWRLMTIISAMWEVYVGGSIPEAGSRQKYQTFFPYLKNN